MVREREETVDDDKALERTMTIMRKEMERERRKEQERKDGKRKKEKLARKKNLASSSRVIHLTE